MRPNFFLARFLSTQTFTACRMEEHVSHKSSAEKNRPQGSRPLLQRRLQALALWNSKLDGIRVLWKYPGDCLTGYGRYTPREQRHSRSNEIAKKRGGYFLINLSSTGVHLQPNEGRRTETEWFLLQFKNEACGIADRRFGFVWIKGVHFRLFGRGCTAPSNIPCIVFKVELRARLEDHAAVLLGCQKPALPKWICYNEGREHGAWFWSGWPRTRPTRHFFRWHGLGRTGGGCHDDMGQVSTSPGLPWSIDTYFVNICLACRSETCV